MIDEIKIKVIESAKKHGFSEGEIIEMIGRAFKRKSNTKDSNKSLLYAFDKNANLVEIGYERDGQTAVVFHCMRVHNSGKVSGGWKMKRHMK
jgi:hypothetical protein